MGLGDSVEWCYVFVKALYNQIEMGLWQELNNVNASQPTKQHHTLSRIGDIGVACGHRRGMGLMMFR